MDTIFINSENSTKSEFSLLSFSEKINLKR